MFTCDPLEMFVFVHYMTLCCGQEIYKGKDK
jgi:hypothetical protein